MKAVVINRVGGTEVLEMVDRPDPVAHVGQALVEVGRGRPRWTLPRCEITRRNPVCDCKGSTDTANRR